MFTNIRREIFDENKDNFEFPIPRPSTKVMTHLNSPKSRYVIHSTCTHT
jgi:hypothetical protein